MNFKIKTPSPSSNKQGYKETGSIPNYVLAKPIEIVGEETGNSTTYLLSLKRGASTFTKPLYFNLPKFEVRNPKFAGLESQKHLEMICNLFWGFGSIYLTKETFDQLTQDCVDKFFGEDTVTPIDELNETVDTCVRCWWESLVGIVNGMDLENHKGYLFLAYSKSKNGKYYANPVKYPFLTRKFYYGKNHENKYCEGLEPLDEGDGFTNVKEAYWMKPFNTQFTFQSTPHVETDIRGLSNESKTKILLEVPAEEEVDLTENVEFGEEE